MLTEKKYNFAPKLDAATLASARVFVYGQRWNLFVSKWSQIFQISLLIWTSKIPKMELQTKEFKECQMTEKLEMSIDDQKSVNTCRSTKFAQRLTNHGNWKNNDRF